MFWCVLPLFFRAYFLPVFEHELHRFAHLLLLSACLHGGEHRPSLFSLDAYKVFYRMALRSFVFRRVVCWPLEAMLWRTSLLRIVSLCAVCVVS